MRKKEVIKVKQGDNPRKIEVSAARDVVIEFQDYAQSGPNVADYDWILASEATEPGLYQIRNTFHDEIAQLSIQAPGHTDPNPEISQVWTFPNGSPLPGYYSDPSKVYCRPLPAPIDDRPVVHVVGGRNVSIDGAIYASAGSAVVVDQAQSVRVRKSFKAASCNIVSIRDRAAIMVRNCGSCDVNYVTATSCGGGLLYRYRTPLNFVGNQLLGCGFLHKDDGALYASDRLPEFEQFRLRVEGNVFRAPYNNLAPDFSWLRPETTTAKAVYFDDLMNGQIYDNTFIDYDLAIMAGGGFDVDAFSNQFVRPISPFADIFLADYGWVKDQTWFKDEFPDDYPTRAAGTIARNNSTTGEARIVKQWEQA